MDMSSSSPMYSAQQTDDEQRTFDSPNENKDVMLFEPNNTRNKFRYTLVNYIKEEHFFELFCIQLYKPYEAHPDKLTFATVGSTRCSIYEYVTSSNDVQLVFAYKDADDQEVYYTCAWTTISIDDSSDNEEPVIAIAGLKGIIRTLAPFSNRYTNALIGHGSSINDLRFHPKMPSILLSSSKDYTLRLWNIMTSVCIAILGGAEGHRDEVLSGDFNLKGTLIMSCSIDHSLKMWNINNEKMEKAMNDSQTYKKDLKSFPTIFIHFPDFTTRDVHTNYIDCVRWHGDLILSKSCENCVILWKPGLLNENIHEINRFNKNVTILHKLNLKECDIWYVRFGLDFNEKLLALGTKTGKMYVWDLDVEDPSEIRKTILVNSKSKMAIRCVTLSLNGHYLLAVNDEGMIFIWKKELIL